MSAFRSDTPKRKKPPSQEADFRDRGMRMIAEVLSNGLRPDPVSSDEYDRFAIPGLGRSNQN